MDPLVLLFLSKTEKVEEFLENNNFTHNLGDLSELDELGLTSSTGPPMNDSSLMMMPNSPSTSLNSSAGHNSGLDMLNTFNNNMDMLNNNQPRNMLDKKMLSLSPSHSQPLSSNGSSAGSLLMSSCPDHTSPAFGSYGRLEESSPEVSSTDAHSVYSFGSLHASSPAKTFDCKSNNQNLNDDFWDLDISGKDEMSPSSMDSSMDPKKKKGPVPRQQEELCLVCGDRASGYHYNALTCEGCKGFFRRSITKNAVYQCKYGNSCEIDMYMRRKCQECRLKKCLQMGMRPECVVPEYQCAIKRENKRQQKELTKPNSTTREVITQPAPTVVVPEPIFSSPPPVRFNKLTPHQEEMIKKLVFFQEEFESPSDEDVKKITPFTLGESEEDGVKRFQHVTEMTILTVQLIVEFSKRVPGFDTLLREDQITLLKACSSEVMMLRCSRKYDIKTDSIVYANNQPYTRENYNSASIGDSADALFNFCKTMCVLKVDNAEYALLTAIVIFSERPQLLEPKKVEKIQEFYIDTLKAYVDNNRQPANSSILITQGKCYFAKLLAILTELRTLGNINSEQCVSLKVQNKKLPPFLVEIWDIDPVQEQ